MRPLRLELSGFTSFRQKTEIDFTGLDLFAITGPTGAGKSSLIDAIVYALYGETPRVGNNVGELISLGANRAEVFLEFATGPRRYRITRIVRRTKNSVSSDRRLERLSDDGQWVGLADREREAREQISEIVGLDFKGFTRSVVLPQGEFDRFLKGEPGERRRILTALLQLRVYEEMGRRARERAKDATSRATTLRRQLEANYSDATPETLRALEEDLARLHEEHARLIEDIDSVRVAEAVALEIRRLRQQVHDGQSELSSVQQRLQRMEQSQQDGQAALEDGEAKLSRIAERIGSLGYDAELHLSLSSLEAKAERLDKLRHSTKERKSRAQQRREAIDSLTQIVEQGRAELAKAGEEDDRAAEASRTSDKVWNQALGEHGQPEAIRELAGEASRLGVWTKERDDLLRRAEELEERIANDRRQIEGLAQECSSAETACHDAQATLDELRLRHSADHLRETLEAGKPCPVCDQIVNVVPSAKGHPALAAAEENWRRGQAALEDLRRRLSDRDAALKLAPKERDLLAKDVSQRQERIEALVGRLTKTLGRRPGPDPVGDLEALASRLEGLRHEAEQRRGELVQATSGKQAVERRVDRDTHNLEMARQELDMVLQSLDRDQKELEELSAELGEWSDIRALRSKLSQLADAKREETQLTESREALLTLLGKLRKETLQAAKEIHLLIATRERLGSSLEQTSGRLRESEASLAKMGHPTSPGPNQDEASLLADQRLQSEASERELSDRISRSEEKRVQLSKRIKQAGEIEREAKELEAMGSVAHQLGRTLGAGFITFIQEEALTRLAEGGTRHLLTLSTERYSFAVSQGHFFVIDHWNADETRSVTTLSGGESFLASLALALALAESLAEFCAERERFSLESLFLDEGFSTLDPETLDIVFQGIERLAAEDRMIGVVSHIADLAGRFPSRIQVLKAVGGSTVELV